MAAATSSAKGLNRSSSQIRLPVTSNSSKPQLKRTGTSSKLIPGPNATLSRSASVAKLAPLNLAAKNVFNSDAKGPVAPAAAPAAAPQRSRARGRFSIISRCITLTNKYRSGAAGGGAGAGAGKGGKKTGKKKPR